MAVVVVVVVVVAVVEVVVVGARSTFDAMFFTGNPDAFSWVFTVISVHEIQA